MADSISSVVQAPAGSASASYDVIAVPSGQPVMLQDVIWNVPGPDGLTLRFRFIAPQIAQDGGSIDYNLASADMQHLCESYVLPRIAEYGPEPQQIIISLADREVEFGDSAPDVTQFFDAYSYQDGICILEAF